MTSILCTLGLTFYCFPGPQISSFPLKKPTTTFILFFHTSLKISSSLATVSVNVSKVESSFYDLYFRPFKIQLTVLFVQLNSISKYNSCRLNYLPQLSGFIILQLQIQLLGIIDTFLLKEKDYDFQFLGGLENFHSTFLPSFRTTFHVCVLSWPFSKQAITSF